MAAAPTGQIQKAEGRRKPVTFHAPGIIKARYELAEPTTQRSPESPLQWTCKNMRRLAAKLQTARYRIVDRWVADQLHKMSYSLQGNAKTIEVIHRLDEKLKMGKINGSNDFLPRKSP